MAASDLIALGVGSPSSVGALVLFGLFDSVMLSGALPVDMLVSEAAYSDVARSVSSQFHRTIGSAAASSITSEFQRTVGYTDVARTIAVG